MLQTVVVQTFLRHFAAQKCLLRALKLRCASQLHDGHTNLHQQMHYNDYFVEQLVYFCLSCLHNIHRLLERSIYVPGLKHSQLNGQRLNQFLDILAVFV